MRMMKRLSITAALLVALGPTTISGLANADDRGHGHRHHGPRTVQDKGRYVSNAVNQVALQDAYGTPVGQAILIRSQATGRWGDSVSTVLMQWDTTFATSPDCYDGMGLVFPVVQYDIQTTYSDLSSTYGNLSTGEICVNPVDFSQSQLSIEVNVIGGTGRFSGATGVTRIQGQSQALPPGRFSVSEGHFKSTLTLP